jgi:hypothetical protein
VTGLCLGNIVTWASPDAINIFKLHMIALVCLFMLETLCQRRQCWPPIANKTLLSRAVTPAVTDISLVSITN